MCNLSQGRHSPQAILVATSRETPVQLKPGDGPRHSQPAELNADENKEPGKIDASKQARLPGWMKHVERGREIGRFKGETRQI